MFNETQGEQPFLEIQEELAYLDAETFEIEDVADLEISIIDLCSTVSCCNACSSTCSSSCG